MRGGGQRVGDGVRGAGEGAFRLKRAFSRPDMLGDEVNEGNRERSVVCGGDRAKCWFGAWSEMLVLSSRCEMLGSCGVGAYLIS